MKTNKATLILLFGLSVFGCKTYENKNRYELTINEKVEIYYSTNSCCFYCVSNEDKLKHVKLIERKTVDTGPSDCDGCNYMEAFVFEGKSIGRDTIELKLLGATMDCDSNDVQAEKYIIDVK